MSKSNRLPLDPSERALELVRRSAPSPSVPPTNLPSDLDQMVREGERNRAVVYAAADDLTDRCAALAEEISSSGIIVDVFDDEEDSFVSSLDGLATACNH